MTRNGLFSKLQHGFLNGKSCTTQLLAVLDQWTQILENNENVDSIYLDFQKAFDSVPHERLLRKIYGYGIRGEVLKWIKAFLMDREQRVVVNNSTSSWSPVLSGIPQGSVLGPLLFLIYINDMPDKIDSFLYMFADDTKVFAQVNSDEEANQLQKDLDKLYEWSNKWQIKFNASKCKVLHLGKANSKHEYSMYKNDDSAQKTILEETLVEKDLGVYLDKDLNFDFHIKTSINKANKVLGLIRRSFKFLNEENTKLLYVSLIRPILEYGNVVWSPKLMKHVHDLERTQRRVTKLIPNLKDKSYEERLKALKLPTLAYRRLRGDVIETYKYTHSIYKVEVLPFKLDNDTSRRNNGYKILKERYKNACRQNYYGNRVVNGWNALPSEVVQAPSLNSFKSRIDRHWKDYKFVTETKDIIHKTNSATSLTSIPSQSSFPDTQN